MNTLSYAICAVLVLGYPLLWVYRGRTLAAFWERAFKSASEKLVHDNRELSTQVELARGEAQTERDKASRYLVKITDFEKERDQWQLLYTRQSIGHGNAQNLMMQTIERLARQLQAKGVRVQLPKVLHEVREEFLENHELPARQIAEIKTKEAAQLEAERAPELPVTADAPAADVPAAS